MNRQVMPTLDIKKRTSTFEEVALGYTWEEALKEASRCLQCKHKPCVGGCPVNIDIPRFIRHIVNQDVNLALETIQEANLFPAICGRVCPQESQCESVCVRRIKQERVAIGRLERFVADHATQAPTPILPQNNRKVAIVGSGPSGLTCANELANLGYDVTIFEALHIPGGVLAYGIPEFRLPKDLVNSEIEKLTKKNVKIQTNTIIGKTITLPQLQEMGFESIYIATGAGLPKFAEIPGEQFNGVFSANEYLTRVNLMKAYLGESETPIVQAKNVCVIGGGNVAMDAARCALRMGAENVYIVYRRSWDELPAREEELHHAKEEGIKFRLLTSPVAILGDEHFRVKGLECEKTELTEPDASGRRRPVVIPNSLHTIDCDAVIMALGNFSNPLLTKATKGLATKRDGCLVVNEAQMTSIPGVFAGGDIVTGAATVILAMGAGKTAAIQIHEYLNKDKI